MTAEHHSNTSGTKPYLAILGPTCSGKSSVALQLAHALNGEIISCDSMQIYKGMTIGTAKPTPQERRAVPHHLLDCLPIHQPYDVNRFTQQATLAIHDIHARGKLPILVGGTGLYARALIYGYKLQPSDHQLFTSLSSEFAATGGPERLLKELLTAFPDAPDAVRANNRRLIRTLEIHRLGGVPSFARDTAKVPAPSAAQFVILPDPASHRLKIDRRTAAMLATGWIEEVQALLTQGFLQTPTARQALGYADIARFLQGEPTPQARADLHQHLVARTWQYARRQRTWFRHQHSGAVQLPLRPNVSARRIADAILSTIRRGYPQLINSTSGQ